MLPATHYDGTVVKQAFSCSYFLHVSGYCETDNVFTFATDKRKMRIFKPGGSVTTRHHHLDTRVCALYFAYQTLSVQGGHN